MALRTGDLIFFSNDSCRAALVRCLNYGDPTHVGMVVENPNLQELFLLQSEFSAGEVTYMPLEVVLRREEPVFVRQLTFTKPGYRVAFETYLTTTFLPTYIETPYEHDWAQTIGLMTLIPKHRAPHFNWKKSLHCSEIILLAYKEAGLMTNGPNIDRTIAHIRLHELLYSTSTILFLDPKKVTFRPPIKYSEFY